MLASCSALLVSAACASADPVPMLDLPPRPSGAPGGAEIARELRALDLDTREERIFAEIARGNVPSWLRRLERVEISGELDGRHSFVTFWATPDYLAVGSDADFLLVPLSPRTAQRIASDDGVAVRSLRRACPGLRDPGAGFAPFQRRIHSLGAGRAIARAIGPGGRY